MASLIGQRLGKYEIVGLIGHGGMATVYKGYQPDVDRYVAIKVLLPHPGRDEQFTERFRVEARTIARLQHPHILPLYDYGDHEGILYLAMAYVPGGSLSDRIRKGPMPPAEVSRLLVQIAPALDYAHRQGIVHRDIKPDNVLLDGEGHALLADFGIARLMEAEARLTLTGSLVGTPAYMSPEQGQGLPVEPRSDIYSLGVVAYEMITGRQPYSADTPMQIVIQHLTAPVPSLKAVMVDAPDALDTVLQRVLAKSPADRYATAAAFADDFSRALHGQELAPVTETSASLDKPTTTVPLTPLSQRAPETMPVTAATPTSTTTQVTLVAPPGISLALVALGVVVIVALVATVLILALRDNRGSAVNVEPTVAPTAVVPTAAPPATVRAQARTQPVFGTLGFSTTNTPGDTIDIQVQGLVQPASGHSYVVWVSGTDEDAIPVLLGVLRVNGLGNGVLTYTDEEGRILPSLYHKVMISEEETVGDTPAGEVRYMGSVPPEVAEALGELFVASDEGVDGGSLLDGLMSEANIARQHAGLAANSNNAGGLHTHAEHTINILLGTRDDLNGDGNGQNPGRGFGIAYFLDRIEEDLSDAANAPTATAIMQSQAELIRVCTQNIRAWLNEIVELERDLLAAESPEAVVDEAAESTALSEQMINGYDLNENGQVEPFEGECGIAQIPTYGILVGNLEIVSAE